MQCDDISYKHRVPGVGKDTCNWASDTMHISTKVALSWGKANQSKEKIVERLLCGRSVEGVKSWQQMAVKHHTVEASK